MIGKTDLNAVYRKIHKKSQTKSTCIVITNELSFFFLHLTFGTITAPSEYTTIIEAEIDIRNCLLMYKSQEVS